MSLLRHGGGQCGASGSRCRAARGGGQRRAATNHHHVVEKKHSRRRNTDFNERAEGHKALRRNTEFTREKKHGDEKKHALLTKDFTRELKR
jgi:hypothetical protein